MLVLAQISCSHLIFEMPASPTMALLPSRLSCVATEIRCTICKLTEHRAGPQGCSRCAVRGRNFACLWQLPQQHLSRACLAVFRHDHKGVVDHPHPQSACLQRWIVVLWLLLAFGLMQPAMCRVAGSHRVGLGAEPCPGLRGPGHDHGPPHGCVHAGRRPGWLGLPGACCPRQR